MVLTFIFFWEGSTNTFHLPCGMITPMLFDIVAITGLSPLGETYYPTLPTNFKSDFSRPSLTQHSKDHHVKNTKDFCDMEHIAFLTSWLLYYLLCPSTLQIAKDYTNLAIQIHEGRNISLGKLLLAFIYQSMGLASLKVRILYKIPKTLLLSGPLWLLQHWLNATFEYRVGYPISKALMHFPNN